MADPSVLLRVVTAYLVPVAQEKYVNCAKNVALVVNDGLILKTSVGLDGFPVLHVCQIGIKSMSAFIRQVC